MGHDKRYLEFVEKSSQFDDEEEIESSSIVIMAESIVSISRTVIKPEVDSKTARQHRADLSQWNQKADDADFGWDEDDDDLRSGEAWENWLKENPKPEAPVPDGEPKEEVTVKYVASGRIDSFVTTDSYEIALSKWTDGAAIVS